MPSILWLAIIVAVAVVLNVKLGQSSGSSDMENEIGQAVKLASVALVLLLGGIPLLKAVLTVLGNHLAVTDRRVIGKTGVLKINALDIHIDKVDNVSVNANFWGNLFHYYVVEIKSTSGDGWKFTAISNAKQLKNLVNDAVEKHAEEARKAQAEEIAKAMGGK